MRKRSSLKLKIAAGTACALALVSGARAFSCNEVREPMVKFIDFYIASEQADAPPMSTWERVLYGLAIAKSDTPVRTVVPTASGQGCS